MSELMNTNTMLKITSQRSNTTKNRNGDVYLFENGLKEYIGSANLLGSLKFNETGSSIPKEMIEEKTILEIVPDEQYDDLHVYIPYSKKGKLIIPVPVSEKRARSWNYRYYDCTVSGSTVWPDVLEIGKGVLRIITLLCDMKEQDKTIEIYSHWTYVNENIVPAYFQYP